MLVFASVAALRLTSEWGMSYAALIPYATPGFVAFGVCAVLAGWIADKWSREGMIVIFFIGIGVSSILAGLANTPIQIALGLTLIGIFAAIYHPVGLAMVVQGRVKTGMPLAVNGVFGNLGVASAALLTGFLIDSAGWRSAFFVPGVISILLGLSYWVFVSAEKRVTAGTAEIGSSGTKVETQAITRQVLLKVFAIIFFTTAIGGLIFQSTTFALPKIFAERLTDIAGSATLVGWYAFLVFFARSARAAGDRIPRRPPFSAHRICNGGAVAGDLLLLDDASRWSDRAAGIDRFHVRGIWPDPDKRCAGWKNGAQRMA